MRQSRQEIIYQLVGEDNNRRCPNPECHSKEHLVHRGFSEECEFFFCNNCWQQWSVGYELVLSVRVKEMP